MVYTLKDPPSGLWKLFRARAKREGRGLRFIILTLIERYVAHGL